MGSQGWHRVWHALERGSAGVSAGGSRIGGALGRRGAILLGRCAIHSRSPSSHESSCRKHYS